MEPRTTMIEGLWCKYQGYLHQHLTHMLLGDQESARDVAQQAFLTLYQTYRPDELRFPRAILFKTATNFALMYIRHRRTAWALRPYVAIEELSDDTPHRQAMADQTAERLVSVIKELRPTLRDVFVMAHVQGKPRKEIAVALGISEKRLDKRMTRALKTCRERLAAHGIKAPE